MTTICSHHQLSYSSHLMTNLTNYRNEGGLPKKVIAQIGYISLFSLATIETIFTIALTCLSLLALPLSKEPIIFFTKRLQSSAFTTIWSFSYTFINLFAKDLMSSEYFIKFKIFYH